MGNKPDMEEDSMGRATISRPVDATVGSRKEIYAARSRDDHDRSRDPLDLLEALRASGGFSLDTRFGGMFHCGKISIRQIESSNSLHLTLVGTKLSAHVDRFSPLGRASTWAARYSIPRVILHNVAHVVTVICRAFTRKPGCRRLDLECERVLETAPKQPEQE